MELERFNSLDDLLAELIAQGKAKNKTEARKKAGALIPKESVFQSKILKYIKGRSDCFAWKDAAGMYQVQGIPDIITIKDGLFYGFEVKRPFIGKLSDIQRHAHEQIQKAGGRVYVVSFVSEVQKILDGEA